MVSNRKTWKSHGIFISQDHVCLILFSSEFVLPPLQRGPTTSSMPKPWMQYATGPSVSTSPPTSKVWVMATVLSFTVRWVCVQLHYFCMSCSVCLCLPVSILMGSLNTLSGWGDSERMVERCILCFWKVSDAFLCFMVDSRGETVL